MNGSYLDLISRFLKGILTHFVFIPIVGAILVVCLVWISFQLPGWANDYVIPWVMLAGLSWLIFLVFKGLWLVIKEDIDG